MADFDVAAIVPSTRDLLQVLATRRQRLAIVALIEADGVADVARLDDLGVAAFACLEAGAGSVDIARSTKTVPVLVLAEVATSEDALASRFSGADGVCLPRGLAADEWDRIAKAVRTTRMLALATAADARELDLAVNAGARVILLHVATSEDAVALAVLAPKSLVVVARIESAGLEGLASVAGKVDAVIVPPLAHRDPAFADFVKQVDP